MRQTVGPMRATVATLLALSIFQVGCRSPERVADAPVAQPAQDPATYLDVDIEIPPGGEGATESTSGISDRDCVGRLDPGEPETSELADWRVTRLGYRLVFERKAASDRNLVLGVIADIKEDTGENLFNIGRFVAWWQSEGVDAVVVVGDAGETVPGLARALGALAGPGWPVLVINGNREAKEVYLAGLAEAQARHPNVFNMGQQRVVELPGATLLAVPGYHDPRYFHARTACRYHLWDVASLVPKAREAPSPPVLVAHSGPRGGTVRAIDFAREAGNVGDANLNRLVVAGGIRFGLFAHIHEAGGRATDLTGEEIHPEDALLDSFYLNVGPADSLPWGMNDRSSSRGMAGVVRFDGDRAAYRIHRLPALTASQAEEARALEPGAGE
jgi:Icc-related predicted phosphoesterase